MKIEIISELYAIIAKGTENVPSRKHAIRLRKSAFNSFSSGGFTKVAFDTRRIDQGTEIIPRRNLQNYQRSEEFVTEATGKRLKNLAKIRRVLGGLKNKFGHEHEWQDSNARVLLSTIDKGLRLDFKDGDYTDAQPGVGNLAYIDELLHVRYRLSFDDICKMAESDLEKVILSKDEDLTRQDVYRDLIISKGDISTKSYDALSDKALEISKGDATVQNKDTLLEKLFGNVRATNENKSVERTVTITIKDSYLDEDKVEAEVKDEDKKGK